MQSNFKRIVMSTIGDKKEKVYNAEGKIREIERNLDRGKIDAKQAMGALRNIFKYHLDTGDYYKIEKELSYNIK